MIADILMPYRKSVTKEEMIKNKWQIISKINFGGELFLRDFEEINTYKGNLNLVPDNAIIYSKINVRHGCIYYHDKGKIPFGVSLEYPAYTFDETKVNGKFLHKILRSKAFKKLLNTKTTGISKARVKQDEFLTTQIPLPSLKEQETLVKNYFSKIEEAENLNKQASDLEGEIEKYFLKQLGVERNEITNRKKGLRIINFSELEKWGLDFVETNFKNNKEYKSYSVRQLCKISSGGTPSRNRKEYYNGDIPWIKTGELNNNVLTDTEEKITEEGLKNSSAKLYSKGSIVIAMYGATIGKTAKLGIDATTNQACAVLFDINNTLIITDYLWEYLQSQTENLKKLAYGSAQPNLNAGIISDYLIPLPNKEKQQKIVNHIQDLKEKIKEQKAQAEQLKTQAEQEFEKAIFN
jgi:type I restriction enzyme S subunit